MISVGHFEREDGPVVGNRICGPCMSKSNHQD